MAGKGSNKGQFQPGDARAGRPRGSANKLTRAAKEAFGLAFEKLGGVKALAEWAEENRTEFYKLYARLIPTEQHIGNPDGSPLNFQLFVPPKAE
jgi:hypothetical protein